MFASHTLSSSPSRGVLCKSSQNCDHKNSLNQKILLKGSRDCGAGLEHDRFELVRVMKIFVMGGLHNKAAALDGFDPSAGGRHRELFVTFGETSTRGYVMNVRWKVPIRKKIQVSVIFR